MCVPFFHVIFYCVTHADYSFTVVPHVLCRGWAVFDLIMTALALAEFSGEVAGGLNAIR